MGRCFARATKREPATTGSTVTGPIGQTDEFLRKCLPGNSLFELPRLFLSTPGLKATIFTGGRELRNSLEDDQSQVIPLWRGTAKVEDIADHGFEDRASALSSVPQ